ncbi:hypothetical protein JB92DRAFT_3100012 [Gautieria morchelliformis]|nr:hypothetical protein JB92DRAFT_3100012 [Gautieria morchelliformis]
MHEAIKFYLGGRLTLAPLENTIFPTSILDMGCGTGMWASQAAEAFPDADVLEVDLFSLPHSGFENAGAGHGRMALSPVCQRKVQREIPRDWFRARDGAGRNPNPNPRTNPKSPPGALFDIVHACFVFLHLAGFEEVLNRPLQLVKPGGWLLLDDAETVLRDSLGFQIVSERSKFQQLLQRYQERKNMNPRAGSAFQGILESSGIFSEVNVRKIVVPISRWEDGHTDIGVQRIAESLRRTMSRLLSAMQEDVDMGHWNSDAFDAAREEMTDQSRDMQMTIYMTWSRRREY